MAARQSTPSSDHSHSSDGVRKRVCKACDRCRLKKSKCDGSSPCSRCRADNAICVFGERKKAHDKVYPKGYVEMLEQQQAWLVHGLQELYRRSTEGEGWPGERLKTESNGHPLTHDLLTRLGALDHSKGERFEENPEAMQQELWQNGMARQESTDSSADSPHSPIARTRFSSDAFSSHSQQQHTMPPTPPTYSPIRRNAAPMHQPVKMEPTMNVAPTTQAQFAMSMQGVVNPLALQGAPQWPVNNNPGFISFDDVDLMGSTDYTGFNFDEPVPSPMYHRQMAMNCMPTDYDDFKEFLNPNATEITSI
ncbi:Fungal Zn(2)-Cys(6) binuclear cluster domain-containing protein [Penicillium ucsense]|uniref:Fungal Zn(2)-Cys(6) binuclear cluster domain-containing protein n=1 Tax=Penicillium ucsense TaxID=2839758 RepID=A0A8J8W1J2_9EURO|nr:Fungal Zn(2)-Cys(6) binuclear cluster domain-containing protein [Penicillium ucsense]KAF7733199.1 Fungal Zn(2)-Cys(6) binuclear cluster domain-containing protein [Penicillium ucsense]